MDVLLFLEIFAFLSIEADVLLVNLVLTVERHADLRIRNHGADDLRQLLDLLLH